MNRETVIRSLRHEKEELDERIGRLQKEREEVSEKIEQFMKEEEEGMSIIATMNKKGGTGKTTRVVNTG